MWDKCQNALKRAGLMTRIEAGPHVTASEKAAFSDLASCCWRGGIKCAGLSNRSHIVIKEFLHLWPVVLDENQCHGGDGQDHDGLQSFETALVVVEAADRILQLC